MNMRSKLALPFLLIISSPMAAAYAQSDMVAGNAQTYRLDGASIGGFNQLQLLLAENWDTHREVRWDIAKPLSAIAYQVYEEEPIITRYFLSSLGFELVSEIPFRSMYGYVAVSKDVMVIAFRGTNLTCLSDWDVNWQYNQVLFSGHYFHKGFVEHYFGMAGDVRRAILQHRPKHIWITGHSLGGALATICAVDLTKTGKLKPTLCTFGQPRVADSSGAQWLDSLLSNRYARFVNGNDVVPSLPPSYPLIRTYGHAGDLYAFGANNLTISDSALTVPAAMTAYCGKCGRDVQIVDSQPVFQSAAELPPLRKFEYEQMLRHERMMQTPSGTPGDIVKPVAGFVDRFTDHKMGNYLRAAYSFGSKQKAISIPGREERANNTRN